MGHKNWSLHDSSLPHDCLHAKEEEENFQQKNLTKLVNHNSEFVTENQMVCQEKNSSKSMEDV